MSKAVPGFYRPDTPRSIKGARAGALILFAIVVVGLVAAVGVALIY
jgi:hypothetical protein